MRSLVTALVALSMLCVLYAQAAAEFGLRYNGSPSAPTGLYWLTGEVPRRGDLVLVCPPDQPIFRDAIRRGYLPPGHCPLGSRPLLKVLAGQGGDRVAITAAGVRINGELQPMTAPLRLDGRVRPMPDLVGFDAELGPVDVVVLSGGYRLGFDSRYFGPLSRSAIVGVARPLHLLDAMVRSLRRSRGVSSFHAAVVSPDAMAAPLAAPPLSHLGSFER